jgi:hypothetical protein
MFTVTNMLDTLKKVNIKDVAVDAVVDTREELIDEQVQEHLEGKNSKGEAIGFYRSPAYAAKKHSMNQRAGFGVVDLELTQSFHRETFVDVREDDFIIDSSDPKTAALIKKYGDKIFGLDPERLGKYATGKYADRVREIITNKTGLTFS